MPPAVTKGIHGDEEDEAKPNRVRHDVILYAAKSLPTDAKSTFYEQQSAVAAC